MIPLEEQKIFEEGIHLFNSGKHYESHEEFESLWLSASGSKKLFLQVLILLAAVEVHKANSRFDTAQRVLSKIKKKLDELEDINLFHLTRNHLLVLHEQSCLGKTLVIPYMEPDQF